jgi:uncharacterized protein HemX
MISLIFLLILIFITLLIYQIILANNSLIMEGLDNYQPYDTNNPQNAMILAQQNAGNIQVLKDQIGDISGLKNQVSQNTKNITTLQTQLAQMSSAQKDYANNLTGGSPPTITGT